MLLESGGYISNIMLCFHLRRVICCAVSTELFPTWTVLSGVTSVSYVDKTTVIMHARLN